MLRKRGLRGVEQLEDKVLLACDLDFDDDKFEIKCDGADDSVTMNVIEGRVIVDVGDGPVDYGPDDTLGLKDIYIDTGNGDDFVRIHSVTVLNNIEVKTGNGNDRIFGIGLNLSLGHDLKIDTGNGDDFVGWGLNLVVENSADIKTGNGDDVVGLFGAGATAGHDIKIDGGRGDDELFGEALLSAGDDLEIKNFEDVS